MTAATAADSIAIWTSMIIMLALVWDYEYTNPANVTNLVVLPFILAQLAVLLTLTLNRHNSEITNWFKKNVSYSVYSSLTSINVFRGSAAFYLRSGHHTVVTSCIFLTST